MHLKSILGARMNLNYLTQFEIIAFFGLQCFSGGWESISEVEPSHLFLSTPLIRLTSLCDWYDFVRFMESIY